MNSKKGFTLIELVIVIAIVAIVAGITTDIIISVVRSYSKTKIITEIEQNANFALTKMEKELKTATNLTTPSGVAGSSSDTLEFTREINGDARNVRYIVDRGSGGSLLRDEKDPNDNNWGALLPLIDSNEANGASISGNVNKTFTLIQTNPDVVQIRMTLVQSGGTAPTSFTGQVDINQTIVLRGTY